jgi:heme/copper-type cytochrome/quinol oxidase subunit 2
MIAFAQGFPSGPAGAPEDRHSPPGLAVLRKFRLDAGQRIALAGALLMVVGVFLPFIQYYRHFFNPSLWEQAVRHGTPLGAASLLVLALLSAVLAVKRWYLGLWITGFIAYMALALAFLLSVKLSYGLPVEAGAGAAESWQAPDFFDFHIGWCVLVLGIVLLFIGALIDGILDGKREAIQRSAPLYGDCRRSAFWWFAQCQRGGGVKDG